MEEKYQNALARLAKELDEHGSIRIANTSRGKYHTVVEVKSTMGELLTSINSDLPPDLKVVPYVRDRATILRWDVRKAYAVLDAIRGFVKKKQDHISLIDELRASLQPRGVTKLPPDVVITRKSVVTRLKSLNQA
jgi:hypothetical protein